VLVRFFSLVFWRRAVQPPKSLVAAAMPGAGDLLFESSFQHFCQRFAGDALQVGVPGAGVRAATGGTSRPRAMPRSCGFSGGPGTLQCDFAATVEKSPRTLQSARILRPGLRAPAATKNLATRADRCSPSTLKDQRLLLGPGGRT